MRLKRGDGVAGTAKLTWASLSDMMAVASRLFLGVNDYDDSSNEARKQSFLSRKEGLVKREGVKTVSSGGGFSSRTSTEEILVAGAGRNRVGCPSPDFDSGSL
jgi:hypothetical protein